MSKAGPIVIIEDDEDDREIFEKIVRELEIPNQIKGFPETNAAFDYLCATRDRPFIIFCDINLPGKNGLDFKRMIDKDPELRKKSIPFLFFSTQANQQDVNEAYTQMIVQGFFKKGNDYNEMKAMLKTIFAYWECCKHPNA